MKKPVQKRTLETRARLIEAARVLTEERGFEALRVEEVVLKASVAKGTFFAHFRDKDALMDLLIGARINTLLDALEAGPTPRTIATLVEAHVPLMQFLTCERYVFDVVLRHSGAAMSTEIGPIAMSFGRHAEIATQWLVDVPFRKDVPPALLAEGVQAFFVQVVALNFCALHQDTSMEGRLSQYLSPWLLPGPLEERAF